MFCPAPNISSFVAFIQYMAGTAALDIVLLQPSMIKPNDRATTFRSLSKAYRARLLDETAINAQKGSIPVWWVDWKFSKMSNSNLYTRTLLVFMVLVSVSFGDLPLLKWAIHSGGKIQLSNVLRVVRSGHVELLRWLVQNKKFDIQRHRLRLLEVAATFGRLETIKFLASTLRYGRLTKASIKRITSSIHKNHIDILSWLLHAGYELTLEHLDSVIHYAVIMNLSLKPEVVSWLLQHGLVWNNNLCTKATALGHLGMLKWLRQQGCPWLKDECLFVSLVYPKTHTWILNQE